MMTLKDGKFFKDGQPYPLEFGNKDQLSLIEKVKSVREEGAVPQQLEEDGEFVGIRLTCVCGDHVQVDFNSLDDFYEAEGKKVKCPGCKFRYIVCVDEVGFMFFKLIN